MDDASSFVGCNSIQLVVVLSSVGDPIKDFVAKNSSTRGSVPD